MPDITAIRHQPGDTVGRPIGGAVGMFACIWGSWSVLTALLSPAADGPGVASTLLIPCGLLSLLLSLRETRAVQLGRIGWLLPASIAGFAVAALVELQRGNLGMPQAIGLVIVAAPWIALGAVLQSTAARWSAKRRGVAHSLRRARSMHREDAARSRRGPIADMFRQLDAAILLLEGDGTLVACSAGFDRLLGGAHGPGTDGYALLARLDPHGLLLGPLRAGRREWQGHLEYRTPEAEFRRLQIEAQRFESRSGERLIALTAVDQTEQFAARQELRQSRGKIAKLDRLAGIGRLISGVAHDINSPVQFVGDNVSFLRDAFTDLQRLLSEATAIVEQDASDERQAELCRVAEEIDLAFLEARVPTSFDKVDKGIVQVTEIVRSMKEFAYPDGDERSAADVNRILANTINVTRAEYSGLARVETDFQKLPAVDCFAGELGQVFMNLIVNAAQAIRQRYASGEEQGRIDIRTRRVDDEIEIMISDNGCGIPEVALPRIFDPFFTTKSLGQGSGQGLAICRTIITERHAGRIDVESAPGSGTTFLIRLPNGTTDAGADGG